MADYRECGGQSAFNTGGSRCVLDPGKVKMLILVQHGYGLPAELTAESLKEACHADRPERLYPIKTIVQYAPSGGEAQTGAVGYGPTTIQGYSAKVDTYTLDKNDMGVRANLMALKNSEMDVFLVDDQNIIFGMRNNAGNFIGIPLSVVYPGGQEFDTESANGYLNVSIGYKDVEKYMANADYKPCDFDVVEAMDGLVYVESIKLTPGEGKFALIEHYGRLNVTGFFKDLYTTPTEIFQESDIESVTYNAGDNTITVAPTTVNTLSLKMPSELYTAGMFGVEQWGQALGNKSSSSGGSQSGGGDGEL